MEGEKDMVIKKDPCGNGIVLSSDSGGGYINLHMW